MAYFNEFPNTRTYDADLGWLIVHVKKLMEKFDRCPTWYGVWVAEIEYPALAYVQYGTDGDTYMSIQPVPANTPITDENYWVKTGATMEQILELQRRMSGVEDYIKNYDVKTFDTASDIQDVNIGEVICTRGFYSVGDGGGAFYEVVPDDTGNRPTVAVNGYYIMLQSEPVNILSLGCKINDEDFDNSSVLNKFFAKWSAAYFAPYGDLYIFNGLIVPFGFNGSLFFNCRIMAKNLSTRYAVNLKCIYCHIHIRGIYHTGSVVSAIAILIGGNDLAYHTCTNTLVVDVIYNFSIGIKMESSNGSGVFSNKLYLNRIDNSDTGILIELIGTTGSGVDGFVNQNQFYNLWITGDGTNTKTGIEFKDNTTNKKAEYNQNNFLNLSCEGCGTVVKAEGMISCVFSNIRLNEQGGMVLPKLFDIGQGCNDNVFQSSAPLVYYDNITDISDMNIYEMNFYNRIGQRITNKATFRNGRFESIGKSFTFNRYNVGGGYPTEYDEIEPYFSATIIDVNRPESSIVNINMPNNAGSVISAPIFTVIKLTNVGGGVRLVARDGRIIASTTGEGLSMQAGHVYLLNVLYNDAWSITQIV